MLFTARGGLSRTASWHRFQKLTGYVGGQHPDLPIIALTNHRPASFLLLDSVHKYLLIHHLCKELGIPADTRALVSLMP
jgi:hypothetical protein